MTQRLLAFVSRGADGDPLASSDKMTIDEKLDEALKQTFPASDAFSLLPDPLDQQRPEDATCGLPSKLRV
jgi:hypothetical protein